MTSDVPVCSMLPIGHAMDVLDAMDVDWQSNNCCAACSCRRCIVMFNLGSNDPTRQFKGHEVCTDSERERWRVRGGAKKGH